MCPKTSTKPSTPRLPKECIDMILDNLGCYSEDRRLYVPSSLYLLLTVNKEYFYACVERLYRDPFQTVVLCTNYEKAFTKLVKLIAWISPCSGDPLVDRLRTFYSHECLDFSTTSTTGYPLLDYLSFIREIVFQPRLQSPLDRAEWVESRPQYDHVRGLTGWETLVRAVTNSGPYLSAVQSISIPSMYMSRYLQSVGQMDSVEMVNVLMEGADEDRKVVFSIRIQEVIELSKGLMARQDIRAHNSHMLERFGQGGNIEPSPQHHTEKHLWRRPLQVRLCEWQTASRWFDDFRPQLTELYSVLPRLCAPIISFRDSNLDWQRLRVAPETFDLLAVTEFHDWARGVPKGIVELFPLEGKHSLLSQCRSLKKLSVALHRDNHDDQYMFAWAVKEKHVASTQAADKGSDQVTSLVPLEHLDFGVLSHPLQAVTMRILSDATWAFSSTLQSINIHNSEMALILDLTHYFNDLPELRRIELSHFGRIDCSDRAFMGCPKLESLYLHDFNDNVVYFGPFEPWNLPSLVSLELGGGVAFRFNPLSLKSMSLGLERLVMRSALDFQGNGFIWERENWSFLSKLRHLELDGFVVIGFQWSWLSEHSPLIESVLLISPDRYKYYSDDPYPYLEETYLGTTLLSSSSASSLSSLQSLRLQGWRFGERFFLDVLPTMTPNLCFLDVRYSQNLLRDHVTGIEAKLKKLKEIVY